MGEDRVTDGTRIAELLASEVTGLTGGPLGDLAVVDARSDVTAAPEGAPAYGLAYREERIGQVAVFPTAACMVFDGIELGPVQPAPGEDVTVDAAAGAVRIESGAAVKRAVDVLRATLASEN